MDARAVVIMKIYLLPLFNCLSLALFGSGCSDEAVKSDSGIDKKGDHSILAAPSSEIAGNDTKSLSKDIKILKSRVEAFEGMGVPSLEDLHELKEAFFQLGKVDFDESLRMAEGLPLGSKRGEALAAIVDVAGNDERLVSKIVSSLVEAGFPEDWRVLTNLLQAHDSKFEPSTVKKWLDSSDSIEVQKAVAASLGRVIHRGKTLQESIAELNAMSLPQDESDLIKSAILSASATSHLESAMSFVEGMNSDSIDERFVHQVIYSVAIKDPNGAKVWVPQQAAKLDRPELVGDLVKIFLQTDSIAASEWVGQLPAGSQRDHAVREIIDFSARTGDLEGVRSWVGLLNDPKVKTDLERKYNF